MIAAGLCRYDSENEGVAGSGVLCEAHNDVGLLTLDPCAAEPGLQVAPLEVIDRKRRSQ